MSKAKLIRRSVVLGLLNSEAKSWRELRHESGDDWKSKCDLAVREMVRLRKAIAALEVEP